MSRDRITASSTGGWRRTDPAGWMPRPRRSRSSRHGCRNRGCRRACASAMSQMRCMARVVFIADGRERRMLQPVEQVVAQRSLRQIGVGRGVGDPPAGHRLRQLEKVGVAGHDLAAVRPGKARQGFGKRFGAAAGRARRCATLSPGLISSETRSRSVAPLSSISDRLTAASDPLSEGAGSSGQASGSSDRAAGRRVNCSTTCAYLTCTS